MEDLNNQFEESFQEYITSILQINEVPYFNYKGKQTASGPSFVKFISGKEDTINIKRNYSEDIEKMQLKMLSSIIRLQNIWDTEVLNSIWQSKLEETGSGVESIIKLIDRIGDITYTGELDKQYQPLWESLPTLDMLGELSCQIYVKLPSHKGRKFRKIINQIYFTPGGMITQFICFSFLLLLHFLRKKRSILLSPQI